MGTSTLRIQLLIVSTNLTPLRLNLPPTTPERASGDHYSKCMNQRLVSHCDQRILNVGNSENRSLPTAVERRKAVRG